MSITVSKLKLINISAFSLSDILSHSLSQYAVSSYAEVYPNHELNYIEILHLLSTSLSLRIQGLELDNTDLYPTTFTEFNNHQIWHLSIETPVTTNNFRFPSLSVNLN